jgi:equilibrative nucleoside transporter 1/2/3
MSYSSGYLSSLAMMYAPGSQSNPQYQITAGMMAAAMLISGIFLGILFSSAFPDFAALTILGSVNGTNLTTTVAPVTNF